MWKNSIIFFGLMVTTSAAGFALSVSHDAYIKNSRVLAQDKMILSATAQLEPAQDSRPVGIAPTSGATVSTSPVAAPVVASPLMASPLATTMPTPTPPASTQPASTSVAASPPVISSQQQTTIRPSVARQSAAPADPTLRPPVRGDQADTVIPLVVTTRPASVLQPTPAPFTMDLPVYSYSQGSTDTVTPSSQPRIAPSPRYLIGVYR